MSESREAKKREIVQLLRDFRSYFTPFGSTMPLEEQHMSNEDYGPAGLIFAGTEFDRPDLFEESFYALRAALVLLRKEDFQAWASLVDPYLGDPADASMVDDWRKKLVELDKENAQLKKAGKRPRVALVVPRMFLERHDRAVEKLAEYLKNEDLHVIFTKRMSEEEEKKMEDQNQEIAAVVQRLRAGGLTVAAAVAQTAEDYGVSQGMVERIVEFRSDIKPDTCVWGGCERAPFSQNLCQKHYQKKRRAEKKS